jgi:hypothetical protein
LNNDNALSWEAPSSWASRPYQWLPLVVVLRVISLRSGCCLHVKSPRGPWFFCAAVAADVSSLSLFLICNLTELMKYPNLVLLWLPCPPAPIRIKGQMMISLSTAAFRYLCTFFGSNR